MKKNNLHDVLKIYSANRLLSMGYNVVLEVILRKEGKIDLIGFRQDRKGIWFKVGIECLTSPKNSVVKNKINRYKKFFNTFIFAIPEDQKIDEDLIKKNNLIIWKFPKQTFSKKTIHIQELECDKCKNRFFVIDDAKYCPYCQNIKLILIDTNERITSKDIGILNSTYQNLMSKKGIILQNVCNKTVFYNLNSIHRNFNVDKVIKNINTSLDQSLQKVIQKIEDINNEINKDKHSIVNIHLEKNKLVESISLEIAEKEKKIELYKKEMEKIECLRLLEN